MFASIARNKAKPGENMEQRRQRILDAARSIIVQSGVDGLTTRGIAEAAGVTAPTLYNLIGSKDDIIRAMVVKSVEDVKSRLKLEQYTSAFTMIEAIIDAATDPEFEGSDYARAIIVFSDQIARAFASTGDNNAQVSKAGIISIEIATTMCQMAISQNVLRGTVSAGQLGDQLFICYHGPRRDWAYRLISREEVTRRIWRGFYLTLAADASEQAREIFLKKICALNDEADALRAA